MKQVFGRWLLAVLIGSFAVFLVTEAVRALGVHSALLEIVIGGALGVFIFFGPPSNWILDN